MSQLLRASGLLLCSGLCALVYQVAWLRELRLIFGGSTAASAAVLAVFMGGLGAGGVVLGRRASAHPRPLRLYGRLELAIAATSGVTPLLVTAARRLYAALGGTAALGMPMGTAVRVLLALLVLAVPTFLMGGTLPAAAQAVETEGDPGRRRLSLIYGANTLGAVGGVLLTTFVLIEQHGTRGALWAGCLLNAAVALAALWLDRAQADAATAMTDAASAPADAASAPADAASAPAADADDPPSAPAGLVVFAAAVTGFVFLLMELVWYRMLAPLLGGSTFTFGLILAAALFGVGLGGLAYALFGRGRATLQAFALSCGLEALLLAAPFAAGDHLALIAARLRLWAAASFGAHVLGWAAVCAAVVVPASFVAGAQFPLLIALLGRGRAQVARHVDLAYAWNTAGAIAGSLAGGFGLLPLLSAPGAWRAAVVALGALACAAAVLSKKAAQWARIVPIAAAAAALLLLAAPGPTAPFRHGGVGVGRGPQARGAEEEEWLRKERRNLLWEADGVESSLGVIHGDGLAFVLNGKVDGNCRHDASMQVMGGLVGALLHPREIETALVIGLGTGSTAGWLGAVPNATRVDVVEMEPAVLRVARECRDVNRDVLGNPKVHTFIGDAREVLLTSAGRYDLIFSEPSNPYRAGIASLFTREFYEASARRLTDDGLFVQWLQVYEVDDATVRTVFATVNAVFPEVETWLANGSDLLIVAAKQPIALDAGRLRARLAAEPYKSALANVWRVDDLEGLLVRRVGGTASARKLGALAGGVLNTDDRTQIEFGFARAVAAPTAFGIEALRELSREAGEAEPPVPGLRWTLMADRLRSMYAIDDAQAPEPPESEPQAADDDESPAATQQRAAASRARAYGLWLESNLAGALAAWREQSEPPGDLIQTELYAETLAEAGDDAALQPIAALRDLLPAEADAFLGRLRLRQGLLEEAAAALEGSFAHARKSPWSLRPILARSLELAVELSALDTGLGERLYAALSEPFSVHVANEDRLLARLSIASSVDEARLCAEALAPLSPWVPWTVEVLAARARCFQATQDPRHGQSMRDLEAAGGEVTNAQ